MSKYSESTGKPFNVEGVSGHIYTNNETGEITSIGFTYLKSVWNPSGNASLYMRLGGNGRSLTSRDLLSEYSNSAWDQNKTLIDYVTSIVIPRERASAVEAFEKEQYERENGKPWGFVSAKWIGPK